MEKRGPEMTARRRLGRGHINCMDGAKKKDRQRGGLSKSDQVFLIRQRVQLLSVSYASQADLTRRGLRRIVGARRATELPQIPHNRKRSLQHRLTRCYLYI